MTDKLGDRVARPHNTGFASGGVTCKLGVLCFYSSSVLVDSLVLRNPPERKARKRWQKPYERPSHFQATGLDNQHDRLLLNLQT